MSAVTVWFALGAILAGGFVLVSSAKAGGGDFEAKVRRFAGAIAFAEGFWDTAGKVHIGSRPARNNNPGDLVTPPQWSGQSGNDGPYAKFATAQDGWNALYGMLRRDLSGQSAIYSPDMTVSDFAYTYTATEQDVWSENVAGYLGISRDTKLSEWLGA